MLACAFREAGSKRQALEYQVSTVGKVRAHKATLEKDLKSLPVVGVQEKGCQATDRLFHAGFEREREQFVVTVQHAQHTVCQGFNVDVVAGFEGVVGGVWCAV